MVSKWVLTYITYLYMGYIGVNLLTNLLQTSWDPFWVKKTDLLGVWHVALHSSEIRNVAPAFLVVQGPSSSLEVLPPKGSRCTWMCKEAMMRMEKGTRKIMTPKCTMVMNPMVEFVKNSITTKHKQIQGCTILFWPMGFLGFPAKKKRQKLAGRRIKA